MTKNKETYYDDIRDALGEKVSDKKVKKVAEDIKTLQASFLPKKSYKKQLFERLENIYLLDEANEQTPGFGFLKIFSAVFTVFFISGVVFMIHDIRNTNFIEIRKEELSAPEADMSGELDALEKASHKVQAIEEPGETENVKTQEVQPVYDDVSDGNQVDEVLPERNTQEEHTVTPVQEEGFMIEKTMPQVKKTEDSDANEGNSDDIKARNISQPQEEDDKNKNQNETSVEMELSDFFAEDTSGEDADVFHEIEQAEDMEDGIPEGKMMPMESMMFDATAGTMESDTPEPTFAQLCEEYAGVLSEDEMTCVLENGKVCTFENIHTCSQEDLLDEAKEVLEDFSELLGQ